MERTGDSPATHIPLCRRLPQVGVPRGLSWLHLEGQGSPSPLGYILLGKPACGPFWVCPLSCSGKCMGTSPPGLKGAPGLPERSGKASHGSEQVGPASYTQGMKGTLGGREKGQRERLPSFPQGQRGSGSLEGWEVMWAPGTGSDTPTPRPCGQPPAAWVGPVSTSTFFWEIQSPQRNWGWSSYPQTS